MTTGSSRGLRHRTPIAARAPEVASAGVEVFAQAVRYEYSCLPAGHADRSAFTLTVQQRSDGRWSIVEAAGFQVLSDIGRWEYEAPRGQTPAAVLPVLRDDDWLEHHRFDLPTAQSLAIKHAPRIRVNGQSAADVLARTSGTTSSSHPMLQP